MPESSIRWGSRLGALGAGLGVFAYLVGSLLTPLSSKLTTGEAVIPTVLIRGLFVLVALGVVLGLAYYAGMRVAREQLGAPAATDQPAPAKNDRVPAALAGGLVLLIYCLVTRFVSALIVFQPFAHFTVADLGSYLIGGIVLVVLGAGLGGIGARLAFTTRLSERVIVVSPPPLPASGASNPSSESEQVTTSRE